MDESRATITGKTLKMSAATVEQFRREGESLIAQAAAKLPAKVLARKTGLSERYIRAIRQREHSPTWAAAIALAQGCPELRAAMLRWLGVTTPILDARDEAALAAALEAYARAKQNVGNTND